MSRAKAISIFLAFAFAYFLSTLIRAITATLAPSLVEEMSLNSGDLGLLAGGYFLGFAVTQLPLGTWLDRFGPKRVELSFLCVAVIGCVVFSAAQSFGGLLVARVLTGMGVSACLMAPLTAYRRWYAPASQMRANSWMLMVGAFGMVAATLPVQWLLPFVGWRLLFVGLAIALALSMLVMALRVPAWGGPQTNKNLASETLSQPPHPGQEVVAKGYAAVWRSPYFLRMAPLGFVSYGGMVAMQTLWAGPWMIKVAGYSPEHASAGLFWINSSMLVTFSIWGAINPWLSRNGWTAEKMLAYGMPVCIALVGGIAILGPTLSSSAALMWGLFCVSSSLGSQAQPAVGMSFPAELAGRALTAYNLVIFCGVFAMQWGVGLCIDLFFSMGWAEIAAYQGALGVYTLVSFAAYLYFLQAKKS